MYSILFFLKKSSFFFAGRCCRDGWGRAIGSPLRVSGWAAGARGEWWRALEGDVVGGRGFAGGGGAAGGVATGGAGTATAAATTDPADLGAGPAQAGADLVGLDLGDPAGLAVAILVGALDQAAHDQHPVTLAEGFGDVLGVVSPDV